VRTGAPPRRRPFAAFLTLVGDAATCPSFADHPLAATSYAAPVVGDKFAPEPTSKPNDVCAVRRSRGGAAGRPARVRGMPGCSCGFRRLRGVDNVAAAHSKPYYGYGVARVVWPAGEAPSLAECERRCCAEPTCHSVTYERNSSTCTAGLAIAHGARPSDWCWRPRLAAPSTVTSLRLPGGWEAEAVAAAGKVLAATNLVRRGGRASGARLFHKGWNRGHWSDPAGHSHPLERTLTPKGCDGGGGGTRDVVVSDLVTDAVPHYDKRPGKGLRVAPAEPSCPETDRES